MTDSGASSYLETTTFYGENVVVLVLDLKEERQKMISSKIQVLKMSSKKRYHPSSVSLFADFNERYTKWK